MTLRPALPAVVAIPCHHIPCTIFSPLFFSSEAPSHTYIVYLFTFLFCSFPHSGKHTALMSNLFQKPMGLLDKVKLGWSSFKKQTQKSPRKRSGDAVAGEEDDHAVSKRQKTRHRGSSSGSVSGSTTAVEDDSDNFQVMNDSEGFEGFNGSDGLPATKDSGSFGGVDGDSDGFSDMSVPSDDIEGKKDSMKQQFSSPCGVTFQGIIGTGSNAIAALLHDNRVDPPRRIILKRPLRDDDLGAIYNEIKVLRIRGKEHKMNDTGIRLSMLVWLVYIANGIQNNLGISRGGA